MFKLLALALVSHTPHYPVDSEPHQVTLHPLPAAGHASALCDCPGPLINYLSYSLDPARPGVPPRPYESGGVVHVNLMRMINERWGPHFDLGGFDRSMVDMDYLNAWHFWIEDVQHYHGIAPSYVHAAHVYEPDDDTVALQRNRDPGPINTGIVLTCDNCDDAHCDPLRLAVAAQQAIHDGTYRDECVNGCADPEDEMRTRFIEAIYEGGPFRTGGWKFKIMAQQADPVSLQLVRAKLVPVWGTQIGLDLSNLDLFINVLSSMRAYQIHILKPDGQWQFWQWDTNQERLSTHPPQSPYQQCHANYEPPSDGSGTPGTPTPPGNSNPGSSGAGGCAPFPVTPLP